MRARVRSISPRSPSPLMTTSMPSPASASAMPSTMPLVDPVTIATCDSCMDGLLAAEGHGGGVPRDHAFLVGREPPGAHPAAGRAHAARTRLVRAVVQFHAEPTGVRADPRADLG